MENPIKYKNFIIGDPILDVLHLNEEYVKDNLLSGFDEDLQLNKYIGRNKKILCDKIFKTLGEDSIKIASDSFVMKTRNIKKHFINSDDYKGDSYSLFTIEYSSISVLKDGNLSKTHKYYNFKNWFYKKECKYKIDNSFVIGRKYTRCKTFNYLARMPYKFDDLLKEAEEHLNTLSSKVIGKTVFPNMKNTSDYPWHNAKKLIAREYKELTAVKGISVKNRDTLVSIGINDHTHIDLKKHENFFHNFNKLELVDYSSNLLFVDFEILTNVYDDFSLFPESNDKEYIFNIGCTTFDEKDDKTFVIRNLHDEEKMMKEFVTFLNEKKEVTLVHWTNIEKRLFTKKILQYKDILVTCDIKWFDLHDYFVESNIYIEGCLNNKLKNVSRCLKSKNLIKSDWGIGGFCDGLGAMTGYMKYLECKDEEILQKIIYYNIIDCRVMAEIYTYVQKDLDVPNS